MTHIRTLIAGLIVTATTSIASTPTAAQTTAPGVYYAPPAWSQTLPASPRFIVLSNLNNEAVLDRETGLVWERSPSTQEVSWTSAFATCLSLTIASRMGWRMPTISELQSLLDRSQLPALPQGHPFINVPARPESFYWSQTTSSQTPGAYLGLRPGSGGSPVFAPETSSSDRHAWCVRGPQ